MLITNDNFTKDEKLLLNFILAQDFKEKEDVSVYINALSSTDIVRDYSPFHIIMEFRTKEIRSGYDGMIRMACVQVKFQDANAPTVFSLYSKDGVPFEYEIYNADSSEIDLTKIIEVI